MPDVRLPTPEQVAELRRLQVAAKVETLDYEDCEGGCGIPCTPDGCLENHPNGYATLTGPDEMREAGEYYVEDAQYIAAVVTAAPALLLAAELLPQMAEALEAAEEDLAEIPGRLDAPSLAIVRKALDRFYAAPGTAEDGAGSAREASAAPQGQGATPNALTIPPTEAQP